MSMSATYRDRALRKRDWPCPCCDDGYQYADWKGGGLTLLCTNAYCNKATWEMAERAQKRAGTSNLSDRQMEIVKQPA